MRFYDFSSPTRRRRKTKMKRQSQNLQRSLFDEDEPHVVLATTHMAELATLVEALLLEIAAALANGGLGDDQDHR